MSGHFRFEIPKLKKEEYAYCGNDDCNILIHIPTHRRRLKSNFIFEDEEYETFKDKDVVKCPICKQVVWSEKGEE